MLLPLLLAVAAPTCAQAILAPPPGAEAVEPSPEAWSGTARWMPAGAALYLALPGLAPWLASGLDHPEVAALLAHPLAQLALAEAPLTPAAAVALVDGLVGRPVLPTLARLAERGVGLGLLRGPGPGTEPRPILVLLGADAELLEEVLDEVFDVLASRLRFDRRLLDAPHLVLDGAAVFRLGDELALARSGATLVVAKTVADVVLAVEAAAGRGPSLADGERFVTARATEPAAPFAWLCVDVVALTATDAEARKNLAAIAAGPAAHFLLGPTVTYVSRAEALGVALHVDGATVRVALEAHGVEVGPGSATFPRTPPPMTLGARGQLAGHEALVHRDMASLAALRAALFPPAVQPAFAKALTDLTPLLGGLDLYDDVLPNISPWLRFVARPVAFDAHAVPTIALPAVCVVARVTDETVGAGLVSAFQTTIGITNLEAAQQRRPALRLDLVLVDGVTVTRARFPEPRAVDAAGAAVPVDVRYNLAPACALVGEHFVLGTHHALVTEVVRELAAAPPTTTSMSEAIDVSLTDSIRLDGAALAALLRANRETLTLNAVLEEGKPRARAEAELEALAALLATCAHIELTAAAPSPRRLSLALVTRLAPPPPWAGDGAAK
jgi:hypothetical protein